MSDVVARVSDSVVEHSTELVKGYRPAVCKTARVSATRRFCSPQLGTVSLTTRQYTCSRQLYRRASQQSFCQFGAYHIPH